MRALAGSAIAIGMLAAVTVNVANAGTISIGFREDAGAINIVAGSGVSDVFGVTGLTTTDFRFNASGVTQPTLPSPGLAFTNTLVTSTNSAAASHFLDIFVTAQGLTGPLGNPLNVLSGFTENLLLGGFTTTLSTFLSSTNALFGGTPVSSQSFNTVGGVQVLGSANTGGGPYSVTAQYHIVSAAGQLGAADSTIGIAGVPVAVPGPVVGAGLPGLLAACFGLLALVRRRRNIAVA